MKISFSNNYSTKIPTISTKSSLVTQQSKSDCFVPSFSSAKRPSSKIKNFLHSIMTRNEEQIEPAYDYTPNKYQKNLAKDLKVFWGKDIPAENLKNIMSPEEFSEILPTFKQENFVYDNYNVDNGIYIADLDYGTNYSNGKENLFDILDKVEDHAKKYYEKTGKQFIFALTDRDSIEGVQHAIKQIAEHPKDYEHIKFVPSVKLTFAHEAPTSALGFENSEMLVYGINPFSKRVINFVESIVTKRRKMALNFVRDVNELYPEFAYNILEFAEQNKLKYDRDYTISNLYWRAREYAETKGDTVIRGIRFVPETVVEEAENILNELDLVFIGSNSKYSQRGSDIVNNDEDLNKQIKNVFYKYSTHMDDKAEKPVSAGENVFEDMIECFSAEDSKPVMAYSSPFYLSHYFEKFQEKEKFHEVVDFMMGLKKLSNGMIQAFETEVPKYALDKNLTEAKINKFNRFVRQETDLHEVGGSLING